MAGIGSYKQIKIIRVTGTQGASGNIVETEATLYEGWADTKDMSGSRRFDDRPLNEKTFMFRIRNRPLIVPTLDDVVIYSGRRFTVQDVGRSEEKKFTYEIIANGRNAPLPAPSGTDFGILEEDGDNLITEDGNTLVLE